jgi:hypothetical protein
LTLTDDKCIIQSRTERKENMRKFAVISVSGDPASLGRLGFIMNENLSQRETRDNYMIPHQGKKFFIEYDEERSRFYLLGYDDQWVISGSVSMICKKENNGYTHSLFAKAMARPGNKKINYECAFHLNEVHS